MLKTAYDVRISDVSSDVCSSDLRRFPDAGCRVRSLENAAPGFDTFVDRTTLFLGLVGLTSLLVGGVGVAMAVKAYLDGKTETIATLKCLGAPNALVFRTYLAVVLVLAAVGTLARSEEHTSELQLLMRISYAVFCL